MTQETKTETALIQRGERIERLEEELKEALGIVDKLLDRLDDYYETNEGSHWVDKNDDPAPMRNWLMLKCFGEDHELYDAIRALQGRSGRTWR